MIDCPPLFHPNHNMKIYASFISFDKIEDPATMRSLRTEVLKWYPRSIPSRYAVIGESLIVTNNLEDDTNDVLEMVAHIGNKFNRRVKVHFDEMNFDDFQNGERVATTPSEGPASAGANG